MIGCAIPIGVGRGLCFWARPAREGATAFCGTGKCGVVTRARLCRLCARRSSTVEARGTGIEHSDRVPEDGRMFCTGAQLRIESPSATLEHTRVVEYLECLFIASRGERVIRGALCYLRALCEKLAGWLARPLVLG